MFLFATTPPSYTADRILLIFPPLFFYCSRQFELSELHSVCSCSDVQFPRHYLHSTQFQFSPRSFRCSSSETAHTHTKHRNTNGCLSEIKKIYFERTEEHLPTRWWHPLEKTHNYFVLNLSRDKDRSQNVMLAGDLMIFALFLLHFGFFFFFTGKKTIQRNNFNLRVNQQTVDDSCRYSRRLVEEEKTVEIDETRNKSYAHSKQLILISVADRLNEKWKIRARIIIIKKEWIMSVSCGS